jgi:hypothetical protein
MRCVSCNTFSVRVAAESSGVCAVGAVNASSGVGPRSGRVCDPGWYVDADLSCAACAPGAFSAGYTTRTNKRHRHHSSLCSACDPGKFSTAVGADSGETCVEGPAGTRAAESGMTARESGFRASSQLVLLEFPKPALRSRVNSHDWLVGVDVDAALHVQQMVVGQEGLDGGHEWPPACRCVVMVFR